MPITNISIDNSTNKYSNYKIRALPRGKAILLSYKEENNDAISKVPFIGVDIDKVLGNDVYTDYEFSEDLDYVLSMGIEVADGYEIIG